MSGIALELGKKISNNFGPSVLFVIIIEILTLYFSLPLNWLCFLVSGYLLWEIDQDRYSQLLLALISAPLFFTFVVMGVFSSLFLLALLLQSLLIYLLKVWRSWSFAIEVLSIALLSLLFCADMFYANYEQILISYFAKAQNVKPEDLNFLPGLIFVGLGIEVLLFTWLSSRWRHKLKTMPVSLLASASEVRVSVTTLIVTIIVILMAYVGGLAVESYGYILSLPYSIAGISFIFWAYNKYKESKKDANNSLMILIFILLYATFMPLALGCVGLLDVGLNLRKKYDTYLKRR